MSYASALLNGVSSDDKPVNTPKSPAQPKQQPKPQPQTQTQTQTQGKVQVEEPQESKTDTVQQKAEFVKVEGNDGGDLGELFRNEKNHLYQRTDGKKQKEDRIFDKVLNFAGPADVSALGRTCQYFLNQILKNKDRVNNLYARQKIVKPSITFKVDFIEGKDDTETKNVPLSYFTENQRRQNALTKYWAKVVSQAQEARDSGSFDPSKDIMQEKALPVKLHGGFYFAGNKHGPLIAQRELTRTFNWLDACIKLLQGKNRQEVPYLDGGKVILTRYGLGGTKIKVETVFPAGYAKTEEEKGPTVRRYEFAEYCLELRSAAKAFVPLVGTCVVSLKHGIRNIPQDEQPQYLEREKILGNLLKHQTLYTAVKTIKKYLVQGAIPGSELPAIFRKRREEKLRLKQQQAVEYDNIYKFLMNNVPEDFEQAKAQAQKLNEESEKQREREKEERQKAFEERKKKAVAEKTGKKDETASVDSSEPAQARLKKKVVKETDADGFVREKKYIVQQDGELKEAAKTTSQAASPVVKKETKKTNDFQNNPYTAALLEDSYISKSEDQHVKSMHRAQSREAAEERKKQVQKPEGQKKKQKQQPQKTGAPAKQPKGQTPAAQPKAQSPAQPKAQPKQTPKATKQKAGKQTPKGKKKSGKTKALNRNKQVQEQPAEAGIPPVAAALAVACLVAFGYVFMFAG